MHRRILVWIVAANIWCLFLGRPLLAADPLEGTWKLTVYSDTRETDLCLLKIVFEENQQLRATVIARGLQSVRSIAVDKTQIQNGQLRISLKIDEFPFVLLAPLPDDRRNARTLNGCLLSHQFMMSGLFVVVLERTDAQELDPKKSVRESPANAALVQAIRTEKVEEQRDQLRKLLEQHKNHPVAISAAMRLVDNLASFEGDQKAIQALADEALQHARRYGPAAAQHVAWQLGKRLISSPKAQALAATYIRQATDLLDPDIPAYVQERMYKTLAAAYRLAGQPNQAEALAPKIKQLEQQADTEYRRQVPPFKVLPAPPRPAGGRAVVLELFTGTQCPPCVAADVAFDAIAHTYPPKDVILVQYHLHVPGPDPLANPETERRGEWYRVRGTPTAFLNGKRTPPLGGFMSHAEERYRTLRKLIDGELQHPAPCRIDVRAQRRGDAIDIEATVTGLKDPPEKARLIFLLVEKEVRYAAPNGIRFHHHVARTFPGGIEGFPLNQEKTHQTVRVLLGQVQKDLHAYLNRIAAEAPFPDDERPLELHKLRVIALIQNLASQEILHAAITDVEPSP